MTDIISTMGIIKKRSFVTLLDETNEKIEPLWKLCESDVNRSALASPYYCLCSYAFTGTINFKKSFPKKLKEKSAIIQISYIRTRVKKYLLKKKIEIALFWELTPKNLQVHCHGVCHGYPAVIEQFSKWWKRVLGYTVIKPIDNVDKWSDYCRKDSSLRLALPTVVSRLRRDN